MTDLRSTDVPNTTRVSFDIDLSGVSETFADDRTPTGLTRYAEKDITMEVGRLAGGNVIIPSVRFERVEETTSTEPLTAQSEPRPVAVAEELDFDALDVKLRSKLKEAGFVSGSRTEIVGILRELLTDGNAPTKRLQGQGLNREQLTTVVDSQLRLDGWSPTQAAASSDRLIAAIEAAQLDGSLT